MIEASREKMDTAAGAVQERMEAAVLAHQKEIIGPD
jgi:hypothetical protein